MYYTTGYSAEGGAVGGGWQWMGVVLYSKLVHNTVQNTECRTTTNNNNNE